MFVIIRGNASELAEYAVHHPVGRCCTNARTCADVFSLKMTADTLDERELNVGRIRDVELFTSA